LGCHSQYETTVDEMITHLRNGNYKKAYSCCTREEFQSKVSPERFEQVLAEVPFEEATGHIVTFRKKFATRSVITDARLDIPKGPVNLTFYIYRPVFGNDFEVGQILVDEKRLFEEELGDW
jgi:hypothetical protein